MVRFMALIVGLVALLALPCLLVFAAAADDALERGGRAVRRCVQRMVCRRRMLPGRSWRDRHHLAQLDRAINRETAAVVAKTPDPPIERVAADLRRLARQRVDIANRSPVWFSAVQRAYDDRLRTACRELGIEEHIDELTGMDLDIERVRVEGSLQAAGMALGSFDVGWRQDRR